MESSDRRYALGMVVTLIAGGAGVLALVKSGDQIDWASPLGILGSALIVVALLLLAAVAIGWGLPHLRRVRTKRRKRAKLKIREPASDYYSDSVATQDGRVILKLLSAGGNYRPAYWSVNVYDPERRDLWNARLNRHIHHHLEKDSPEGQLWVRFPDAFDDVPPLPAGIT